MVTFSNISYKKAFLLGKKQDKIMKKVMGVENIEEIWDSDYVEKLILKLLLD